ncbi:MAG: glycosyltransferase [Rudaea sp.]
MNMRPLRILTWHIHGNYLYYLTQSPHEFYLPVRPDRADGYGGRAGRFPWGDNVREVPAEQVRELDFDVILFQSQKNYAQDQYEILTEKQRLLPRIYLEHDPPRQHPTDTRHIVDDPNILLVHCTTFNELMWDNNRTPTVVIEHGVVVPDGARYSGELERGIVVVNNLAKRGRRLGADIFERLRQEVPLDLVGINAEELGGIASLAYDELHGFEARYRFFFNPIRYTSLGLAVCEAMMIGMPILGMATTEMVTAVENGVSGYVTTDVTKLRDCMRDLLADPAEARRLGDGARRQALERFNIKRFAGDWTRAFELVTARPSRGGSRAFAGVPDSTRETNDESAWIGEKEPDGGPSGSFPLSQAAREEK